MSAETTESQIATAVAENLAAVRGRIEDACRSAGRPVGDVRLVAVTKYARWNWVQALVAAGQTDLGENRPQQMAERARKAGELASPVAWHLIGQLQRNKAKLAIEHATLVHAVDSLRLAERLSRLAAERETTVKILLEVNVSREENKNGFAAVELKGRWKDLLSLPAIEPVGLMTMAPIVDDPADARPVFADLRELRDDLASTERPLPELSMGMSGDFEAGIAEGATIVRIGSALFEGVAELDPEAD